MCGSTPCDLSYQMPQTGLQSPGVANILSISHVALSLPFDLQLSTYNNAYWFLPKIFAHDWHVKHTWPVTGLQLSLTNQCSCADNGHRFGQAALGSTINKATSSLSHSMVCSWRVSDLLYFLTPVNLSGIDRDAPHRLGLCRALGCSCDPGVR